MICLLQGIYSLHQGICYGKNLLSIEAVFSFSSRIIVILLYVILPAQKALKTVVGVLEFFFAIIEIAIN